MNFCPFCGSKLIKNARFCSQCGESLSFADESEDEIKKEGFILQNFNIENTSDLKHVLPEAEPMHTIKIGKYTLQVPESVIAYNKVRSYFVDYAEQSQSSFETFYDKEVHDFEGLYDKAIPAFAQEAANAIHFAVSELEKCGFSITTEEFLQVAQNSIDLDKSLHEYTDLAKQLMDFVERLNNYRANNRSRSIQWQGGGLGLRGAIGGAITASVLNFATDTVRGIGHMVVDSADRARLKKVQTDLYNARDHKAFLSQRLYDFCKDLFSPTVRLLEENEFIPYPTLDSASGIGPILEAFNLIEHQKELSETDYEKALNLTLQGMSYDPYVLLSYLTLYKIPFVNNKELLKVVKFFGIEDEFAAKVTEYEENELAAFMSMPESTVSKIDIKIAKATELNDRFCYIHIAHQVVEKLAERKIAFTKDVEEEDSFSPDYAELLEYNDSDD